MVVSGTRPLGDIRNTNGDSYVALKAINYLAGTMATIAGWQYNPTTGELIDPNKIMGKGGGNGNGEGVGRSGNNSGGGCLILQNPEGEWRRGRDSGEFNLPH